jgi:hypothetical protein
VTSAPFELNRAQFALWYGLFCVAFWWSGFLVGQNLQHDPAHGLMMYLGVICGIIVTIRFFYIPRMRNIGWSTSRLLWLIVPVAGTVFIVLLFFYPGKKNA